MVSKDQVVASNRDNVGKMYISLATAAVLGRRTYRNNLKRLTRDRVTLKAFCVVVSRWMEATCRRRDGGLR